jgi:hypothetical protein
MAIVPCAWYVSVPAPDPAPAADGVRSMTFSMERASLVVRSRRRCCTREQLQAQARCAIVRGLVVCLRIALPQPITSFSRCLSPVTYQWLSLFDQTSRWLLVASLYCMYVCQGT